MRMRARRSGGVSRHAGNAAFAAATAASISASLQKGILRTTSPLAGLVTSPERALKAVLVRPFTHNGTVSMAFMRSSSLRFAPRGLALGVQLSECPAFRRGQIAPGRPASAAREMPYALLSAAEPCQKLRAGCGKGGVDARPA